MLVWWVSECLHGSFLAGRASLSYACTNTEREKVSAEEMRSFSIDTDGPPRTQREGEIRPDFP